MKNILPVVQHIFAVMPELLSARLFLWSINKTEKITPCKPVISNMPSGEETMAESNSFI